MTYPVSVHYDVRIPMPDGVKLAGNLYLPEATGPWPAILTFIPYHKDGRGGIGRGEATYRHFAARGYAVCHVDFRGTGSSEGTPYRTMDGRERLDGHAIVEWLAAQKWCDGAVGVWGTSYGGITALAIAETRPPHLKAIVPVHAPDDNYEAMFVHRGSRVMFWSDPHWGGNMAASNLMPPLRYDHTGDWLKTWRQRLDVDPWIFDWNGEPPDPDYWARQRVDPSQITVPTFVICGWQDAYPDGAQLVYQQVQAPKRLVLGPWKHAFPETATREPIGILAEIDRWWDRWLKGIKNGVDDELPVKIFVQGAEQWRHEAEWPVKRAEPRTWYPKSNGALVETAPLLLGSRDYQCDARAGLAGLAYDACCGPIPYPADQSADDYRSALYTSEPLAADLDITGDVMARLFFSCDAPLSEVNLVAKLADVAPDGQSFLVAKDNLNAARAKFVATIDHQPVYLAEFPLKPTSYVFKAGHRLRLALGGADFPFLWPTPRQFSLRFWHGYDYTCSITLPVCEPVDPAPPPAHFAPPLDLKPTGVLESVEQYTAHHTLTNRAVTLEGLRVNKVQVEPGSTLGIRHRFWITVDADHPENANSRTAVVWQLDRPTGAVETRVNTVVSLHDVVVDAEIDLDGLPFYRRTWRKSF